jgi:hypothetical protein
VRVLVATALVVGALLFLTLGRGSALPWQPACTIASPSGEVLFEGTPEEAAARVDSAGRPLTRALGAGPAVSCRVGAVGVSDAAKEAPLGLTPRAAQVRDEVRQVFGDVPDGGFGVAAVLPGRSARGEHSMGRAIDFFFRPYRDADQQEAGWRLANWSVANADRLGIRTVIYSDRIWTARRSFQGWREYRFSGSDPDNPVNRHLDHVHVDVG